MVLPLRYAIFLLIILSSYTLSIYILNLFCLMLTIFLSLSKLNPMVKCPSFLRKYFSCLSILSDINVVIPFFSWLLFSWCLFFYYFPFILYVPLYLKIIFVRQHVVDNVFMSNLEAFAFYLECLVFYLMELLILKSDVISSIYFTIIILQV